MCGYFFVAIRCLVCDPFQPLSHSFDLFDSVCLDMQSDVDAMLCAPSIHDAEGFEVVPDASQHFDIQ